MSLTLEYFYWFLIYSFNRFILIDDVNLTLKLNKFANNLVGCLRFIKFSIFREQISNNLKFLQINFDFSVFGTLQYVEENWCTTGWKNRVNTYTEKSTLPCSSCSANNVEFLEFSPENYQFLPFWFHIKISHKTKALFNLIKSSCEIKYEERERESESIYANEKGRKWGRSSMSREQKKREKKSGTDWNENEIQ